METMEKQKVEEHDCGMQKADSRMKRVAEIAGMLGSDCITDAQIEQIKGVLIGMRLADAGRKGA